MSIKVTYRFTSRLSMRIVKNGDVHVSAPIGLSKKKVLEFTLTAPGSSKPANVPRPRFRRGEPFIISSP